MHMRSLGLMAAASMFVGGPAFSPIGSSAYDMRKSTPRSDRRVYRLNRSSSWPRAASYADARAKSPVPNRPVR